MFTAALFINKNNHPNFYWWGKLSVNYGVYIWWSITHSLKCYYEIKYNKMLKNLSDITATNLIHEKEGNFIEDLHNTCATIHTWTGTRRQNEIAYISQKYEMVDCRFFLNIFYSE